MWICAAIGSVREQLVVILVDIASFEVVAKEEPFSIRVVV